MEEIPYDLFQAYIGPYCSRQSVSRLSKVDDFEQQIERFVKLSEII